MAPADDVVRWARHMAVRPSVVRRLSLLSLVFVSAIVLSGAAVRLTESGLGCSDWPECFTGRVTPPLEFHSLIEFGNRMLIVLLEVVIGATFLGSLLRRPFRKDLAWLSGGLVGGVLLEAVLGGLVVYTKLNPYLVAVHFLATMLLVTVAGVLLHRSTRSYTPGSGSLAVPRPIVLLSRGMALLVAIVLAAGAVTTGAAPDSGAAEGQAVAKRIPIGLRDMAELHAGLALLLIGVVVSLAVALHALDVPEHVRKEARMLVVVLVLQGVVGYTQYFTHLPAVLVEIHELGATILVIGVTRFILALTYHASEPLPALRAVPDVEVGPRGLAGASRAGDEAGTVGS